MITAPTLPTGPMVQLYDAEFRTFTSTPGLLTSGDLATNATRVPRAGGVASARAPPAYGRPARRQLSGVASWARRNALAK
jgi:hypothetical protein